MPAQGHPQRPTARFALFAKAACLAFLIVAVATASSGARVGSASASELKVHGGASTRVSRDGRATVDFLASVSPAARVRVRIYRDGALVCALRDVYPASDHAVAWNLRDFHGRQVAPGEYTYEIAARRSGASAVHEGVVTVSPSALDPNAGVSPSAEVTASTAATGSADPAPVTVVEKVASPPSEPISAPDPGAEAVPEPPSATPVDPRRAPATPPAALANPWIGLYVPGAPSDMTTLTSLESRLATRARVVNFFIADTEGFPAARCANVAAHDATPLVTLEFWSARSGGLAAIADGSRDAHLIAFADAARSYGGEVWLRPFHEMNGDWYPWGGAVNGNSSADFIAAWRHLENVFDSRGATNVKFVWSPNAESVPATSANAISRYWPGDDYVDYVALDGYNFGTSRSSTSWRGFGAVFGPAYRTVTGLTRKPLFVAETASAEAGGDKAEWIAEMFASIRTTYSRIDGVVWFSANKETDWRIDSSSASLSAFRNELAR